MKNSTLTLLKGMAIAACLAGAGAAHAANFVAVANGNFTSPATWGGTAPPTNITADNVTIPGGILVTLDQNVSFSGASTLTVVGTILPNMLEDLSITNGATVSGSGDIAVDSLTLGGGSTSFTFTGEMMARTMTSLGLSLNTSALFTVIESVKFEDGATNLMNGQFVLQMGGKVYMSGGAINVGLSGSVLLNLYDVVYTDVSANAGLELVTAGLRKVYIDVPATETVTLTADVTLTDTLFLNSGVLSLNGNDLVFDVNGNVDAGGTGTISSTSASNIILIADSDFGGGLRFTQGANTVGGIGVDMGNNAVAKIESDLNVVTQLVMVAGKLKVEDGILALNAGATLTGASASSYIITTNEGGLAMHINTGASDTLPIGTAAAYAPIMVTVNPGSPAGLITAAVEQGLRTGVTAGTNLAATQPVVNATWWVATSSATNTNISVSPMWSPAMEVNGFNRTEAYVSMNASSGWDKLAPAAATSAGGLYTLTRANVTEEVAAYSVMDKDAVNSVVDVKAGNGLAVYPNPVVNTLQFKTAISSNAPVVVNIYDVAGHLVKSAVAENNSVPVADLSAGFYTAQFTSGQFKATEKFVKQ